MNSLEFAVGRDNNVCDVVSRKQSLRQARDAGLVEDECLQVTRDVRATEICKRILRYNVFRSDRTSRTGVVCLSVGLKS